MTCNLLAGVVLTGGRSSRMGTAKSELVLNGTTLLTHTVTKLRQLDIKNVVISGSIDPIAHLNTITQFACNIIHDRHPFLGPVSGVISTIDALHFQQGDYCVFVPIDMPMLSSSLIRKLLLSAFSRKKSVYIENHFLPFVYRFDNQKLVAIRQMLAEKKSLSMRFFLKHIAAESLPLNGLTKKECAQLINVNTPNDWKQFLC